jgi:regulator of sirC expression with transglutaminase-like and TPR domain
VTQEIDAERVERVVSLAGEGLLAEAALEYARFAYPDLDVQLYLDRLAAMAELVGGTTHLDLRRVVAIREGLGGDIDTYYDPRNSFLNEVMDRRRGIPITLAVVWMEVGRRAGIKVQGVGLPGHFLVYAAGQLVDPFGGGEAIGADEAAALFAENYGGKPRLNPEWLEPAAPEAILERMLGNLAEAYRRVAEDAVEAYRPPRWITACLDELRARRT